MRYRRSSYRYAVVLAANQHRPWGEAAAGDQPGVRFAQTFWRPPADICVSQHGIEVTVDLAGINQDELDVVLYADALVVDGQRRLSPAAADVVYHLAEIPQGPFRLELALAGGDRPGPRRGPLRPGPPPHHVPEDTAKAR